MTKVRNTNSIIPMMVALLILALVLGIVLAGALRGIDPERQRIETAARAQKLAVDIKQKQQLSGFVVAGKVLTGVVVLALTAGAGVVGLRWLDRRASEIRADDAGIFPVVKVRVAGTMILHDPNKALTPMTLYSPAQLANQVTVVPMATGDPLAQERQAARATWVQLAAAQNRHPQIASGSARNTSRQDQDQGDTATGATVEWPGRVPLTGLLNGTGAALDNLVLGVTVDQNGQRSVIRGDMAKMVHVAVGGSAGWGKSVFLQTFVYQLATCPERPDLALVDLDGTTLSPFASCERLLYPLADNEPDALAVFQALAGELERRKELYTGVPGAYDLATYNQLADNPLPATVLITDEATALLGDKAVEGAMRTLALRGRKFGLWVLLAGQDWKASSLDSAIKNQLSTTIQFRAKSASQSRVLLGSKGAESLPVPGRCLALLPGSQLTELQAAHISYQDIVTVMSGQSGPTNGVPIVTQDQVIIDMYNDGVSKRKIQEHVFGYVGGKAHTEVNKVLETLLQ